MNDWTIILGDAVSALRDLPEGCAQCCVTSPPYWKLRSYLPMDHPLKSLEIGQEETPDEYVTKLVDVFREVRRVLADDGVCWLNMGDTYIANAGSPYPPGPSSDGYVRQNRKERLRATSAPGLKKKDPWRVALALQADGWYLRADVIWEKPNGMPENVFDRPTVVHEHVFLLSKSYSYFYDADAIREPHAMRPQRRPHGRRAATSPGQPAQTHSTAIRDDKGVDGHPLGRNKRSVWSVNTEPLDDPHFAAMPQKLAEPCILAGSRMGDTILDPFAGSGTTAVVALRHGRKFIGCELNEAYEAIFERRVTAELAQERLFTPTGALATQNREDPDADPQNPRPETD